MRNRESTTRCTVMQCALVPPAQNKQLEPRKMLRSLNFDDQQVTSQLISKQNASSGSPPAAMGCSGSRTVAHKSASGAHGDALVNELAPGDGNPKDVPISSLLSSVADAQVIPCNIMKPLELSSLDTSFGALSARSIGFNEIYTPIKLLGKGSFGKVSFLLSRSNLFRPGTVAPVTLRRRSNFAKMQAAASSL
jgi:hypothetical protein